MQLNDVDRLLLRRLKFTIQPTFSGEGDAEKYTTLMERATFSGLQLHVDKLPTSPDKQGLFIADQGIHKLSPPSPNPNTRPLPGFGFPAPQPVHQATAWVRVPRAPNPSTRPLPGFGFPAPPTRAPGHCLEPVGIRQLDDSSRTRFYCGRQKMISSNQFNFVRWMAQCEFVDYKCHLRTVDVILKGWKALVERFDENRASLLHTFTILSPKVVDLILSPYGFRIVESFLTVDLVYERMSESLSKEWNGLEKVLKTEKGRYRDWWLMNVEALPILIKAITFCEIDVAKEFIFHEQIVIDLCEAPEGLYCVLKVMAKSRDQPGWKDALSNLILLKSTSTAGSKALAEAILFGDYLVNEVVEIICRRRESIHNSTVSLIIRLIEHGSAGVKELIVKCLCETNENPIIRQIRNTKRFANFTPSQRQRLDDCMTSTRVRSVVDDCIATLTTNESDSMTPPDGHNKKRRSDLFAASQSSAKKPREECAEPQPRSQTTVPSVTTVSLPPTLNASSTVTQVPIESLPPTVTPKPVVTAPSAVPTVTTRAAIFPVSTVSLLPTVTPTITVSTPHTVTTLYSMLSSSAVLTSTVPPTPTVSTQPTVVSSATVSIPTTAPSVKPDPDISSLSSTIPPPPSVPVNRLATMQPVDPGKDVISMAMSEKYSVLLSKLAKGTPKLRLTLFNCIRNALLPLIMDDRGSEVVKWFIVNGTAKQKEEIERKVAENLEDLVTNGGYGGSIAALVIDNCAVSEKKKELSEKSIKAAIGESVSQKMDNQSVERNTVTKVARKNKHITRSVSANDAKELRNLITEIDHKIKEGTAGLQFDKYAQQIEKVASVLHLLRNILGSRIVKNMLFKKTRTAFADYCISNHVDSPIAKVFRAEMESKHCLRMGMQFVKAFPIK
ncbi:hypothetical protein PRIPAC_74973 [Pristionchus pacificus]|uniref:Uncharacterized protein n=1 Tax=Pristionchus pacificus TaxID=54126 RepID=A0A2A6C096_PRIPA|nr:hypothetical protein PRIPAC_74973 [Pristionchus pacificus]|eukprot:PDM71558.1 hypothetical protein PRIPAC_37965 [Pristionchus pacificus]